MLTLTGTNFIAGATVAIGGVTCASPSVSSATSMTCVIGASTGGTKMLTLIVPYATAASSTFGYDP